VPSLTREIECGGKESFGLIFIFHFWKKKINSQLFKKTGGGWINLQRRKIQPPRHE